MTGWLAPVLAGAFWAGILAWPTLRPGLAIWQLLSAGVLGLGAAAWLAPGRASEVPLARAGLLDPGPAPALEAVATPRTAAARGPPGAVVVSLVAATTLFGAGWAGLHDLRVRSGLLARIAPREVRVEGTLATDPEPGARGWSSIMQVGTVGLYDATTRSTTERSTSETVWLEGFGSAPRARRGDRVRVEGSAEPPYRGPFAVSLQRRGIVVVLSAREFARVGASTNPLVRATQGVRAMLLDHLLRLFPLRQAGLLMGLALGDTSRLDPGDAEHFRATGLGHLLAVSGENVAMVLAPVLGLAMLLRLSNRGRFLLGTATVVFFVVLTGAEPSVLRAGVMAGLALVGMLLGRPRSTATLLGAAVLVLLVSNPTLVWSVGFQLSVAATGGMVALAGPLSERLSWLPRPVALAAGTTMSAQVGVSPLLLAYFHQVPLVTLLANLLAFPAVSPALLLGLAAAALATIAPPVARAVARLAGVFVGYLQALADRLASAPLPSITSAGGLVPVVVGFAVVGAFVWWFRGRRAVPRRAAIALAVVVPLFVWSAAVRAGAPAGLEVRFLDVGQGDAALVRAPDGETVLIDGGPDPEEVATDLAALGVKRLDLVVATHPHLDHFTGLPAVLARFPTDLVLDSGCDAPESRSLPYRAFLTAVRQEGVPERHPRRGDVFFVGALRFDVLSPDRCWDGTNSDANNDSLVLLLTYGRDRVLFANEPEASAQQVMLNDHEPITAEVLNVPHHGAGTSIQPFFRAVHETVAVVSVGPNDYGHPVARILDGLRATGARVFRTDHSGDVVITFADDALVVHTGRGRTLEFRSSSR
ncbi:MAG: DNA internalization-related competence protein ComEC/Rec2 [Actinomycetota bacterium]